MFLVNTWCVVGVTGLLVAATLPHLIRPRGPASAVIGQIGTPLFALIGVCQALGTFGRSAVAARVMAIISYAIGAILTFVLFVAFFGGGRPWFVFVLTVVVAGYAAFAGFLNLQWAEELRRPPPAGVCGGCGYDLRATPGRCPECGRVVGSGG